MQYPDEFDGIAAFSRAELHKHPPLVQIALCLHRLEADVNNDGFYGYFSWTSGELVPDTLDALGQIGALHTKELLVRAVSIAYPDGYPSNPEEAAGALANYDDVCRALEPVDAEFYKYVDPLEDLVNERLARGA